MLNNTINCRFPIQLPEQWSFPRFWFSIHRLLTRVNPPDAYKKSEIQLDRQQVNEKAETFLTRYGNSILRLAYSYLHNMDDAEEILQDTLIQYLKTVPRLESPAHEKAWLLRVAGNLSKNRISYNKLRSADELNEALLAEEREDLSFVWDAVKDLPVKYREVIHLFYYEGLSTAQIGEILNQKESTVRSHLMRGRDSEYYGGLLPPSPLPACAF